MSGLRLEPDESLVSYDVTALFTSVPIEDSISIIHRKLSGDITLPERTTLSVDQITSLLRVCLTTTYFLYNGSYYIQTHGAAMGSPVSPIVANLYMEDFEERALSSFPNPPRFWGRYVDDTMTIIKTVHIESFSNHLNNINEHIKFTSELEESGQIPMLDCLMVRNEDNTLRFKVYRKSTHTDHYLQFDSHQPLEHKLGVIRTLTHRAKLLVTEEEDKVQELAHIQKVLSVSGYTKWAWSLPGSKKLVPHPRSSSEQKPKGHVTIPYVRGISEPICRKLRKAGIVAHTRPQNSIRSQLVHPKDKEKPENRCGVVYHLSCTECKSEYIGETERALRKRLAEHRRDSSPVGHHLNYNKHKLDQDNIKIVDKDNRWFERGVREAIHIRTTSPSLNRDQGRHQLPPVYNSLLQQESRDVTTTQSRDHNNTSLAEEA